MNTFINNLMQTQNEIIKTIKETFRDEEVFILRILLFSVTFILKIQNDELKHWKETEIEAASEGGDSLNTFFGNDPKKVAMVMLAISNFLLELKGLKGNKQETEKMAVRVLKFNMKMFEKSVEEQLAARG